MKQMAKPKGRVERIFLASLCLAVVAGCSLPAPERHAPPNTYMLSADSFPAVSSLSLNPGPMATLLISPPTARAGFDTPRMVYLLRPHEVGYYADNQWVDTPARMLAPILAQAMEKSGLWKSVVQMSSAARADYRLEVENLALEQQFFARPSRVRLTLNLRLIDLRGKAVIGAREFDVLEDAPTDDPYGGVVAANRAVGRLLDQMLNWLSASVSEQTQTGQ